MNTEDYHEIDRSLDLLTFEYKDIDVTYLVRNHVISLIRSKKNVGNPEIKLNGKILFRLLKSAIRTLPNLFKRRSVWVFSNAERRKKFGALYYDRVGSLVSENSTDVIFIENPVIQPHKFPTNDIVLSDALFFIGSYVFSIFKFDKSHLKVDVKFMEFAESYGIKTDVLSIVRRFVGQYYFMRFYLKYFYKPKCIFSVYPNGYYGYNYAFKEANIPIIELQHGIIYSLHPSYNTILYDKARLFKPDFIFTYGSRDKECLESLNFIDKDRIYVVGSYGLWKSKITDLGDNIYLKERLNDSLKTVVVIATVNDIEELYAFSVLLASISRRFNVLVLPRQEVTHLSDSKNVSVLDIHKANVFEVYKVADYLITKSSTSAVEALYMGVPTFLLEEVGTRSIFRENYSFISSFNYFSSAKDFIDSVESGKYYRPSKQDINQVYSSALFENYTNALDHIGI